jgi:hypothetical protein
LRPTRVYRSRPGLRTSRGGPPRLTPRTRPWTSRAPQTVPTPAPGPTGVLTSSRNSRARALGLTRGSTASRVSSSNPPTQRGGRRRWSSTPHCGGASGIEAYSPCF